MATATATARQANRGARKAQDSTVVDRFARLGLVSRGVVWLAVGLLAVRISLGHPARADRQGALRSIAGQPFGGWLLGALILGFLGYALWRLLEAAVGHRDERDTGKRTVKRLASLARGVVYLGLAVSTALFLQHGSKSDRTGSQTGSLMSHPGGRWLVGLIGLGVLIGGLALAGYGVKQKFLDSLGPVPGRMRTLVRAAGMTGLAGRGLVIALLGGFVVEAAVRSDPGKARGLDAALKTLAAQPYGRVLLLLAAFGLLAFALWSFLEATYRRI